MQAPAEKESLEPSLNSHPPVPWVTQPSHVKEGNLCCHEPRPVRQWRLLPGNDGTVQYCTTEHMFVTFFRATCGPRGICGDSMISTLYSRGGGDHAILSCWIIPLRRRWGIFHRILVRSPRAISWREMQSTHMTSACSREASTLGGFQVRLAKHARLTWWMVTTRLMGKQGLQEVERHGSSALELL